MRLNKSTGHAVRILLECARAGDGLVKGAEVSERLEITMQNTQKMVNVLARAGLVTAVRGRNGGVKLSRPADEIRIGDIVRALEATDLELEMDTDRPRTSAQVAGVNRVIDSAFEAFISVLDQHTLADMIGGAAPSGAGEASSAFGVQETKRRSRSAPIRVPVVRSRAAAEGSSRAPRK
jgi:Rrf2 family nitric oxide-sensitive transcriptional repressor